MNSEDLSELAELSGSGFYEEARLTNGIVVETLATFHHDYLGWHALVQVWDSREESPEWQYLLIANTNDTDWDTISIIRNYGPMANQSLPIVPAAAIVGYWLKFQEYPAKWPMIESSK